MENKNIIDRLIKLMPISSKDETRHHLCGVCIEQATDRRELILTVTDGHKAIRETVQHDYLPELIGDKKYLVTRDQLPILKAMLKANKIYMPEIKLNRIDTSEDISFRCGGFTFTAEWLQNYPNVEQIIPDKNKLDKVLSFNAQYLIDLANALADGNKDTVIKLCFKDVTTPIIIKNTRTNREAVLMPCRV